jgi:membrane protein DedA with SNARE-associated domain
MHLIATYGYWTVGGIIALESMGLPLPGEATLIAAAVYAATTHHLNIWLVIAAAATGAIVGDNIGYWIGREIGYRLLLRYGHYVYLTEARIKLGQYLFFRHGGKIVFFGRFVAVLRALAAILAGRQSYELAAVSTLQCRRRNCMGCAVRRGFLQRRPRIRTFHEASSFGAYSFCRHRRRGPAHHSASA